MRSDKSAREVTVTGCLARGAGGNFMLNNARMDDGMGDRSSASSNPTTTTAGATTTAEQPTGTTGINPNPTTTTAGEPTTSASAMPAKAMSWKLEGGQDLDKHVGHPIRVTGRTEWTDTSSSSTTTATGHEHDSMSGPRLDVTSVKMISPSCQ